MFSVYFVGVNYIAYLLGANRCGDSLTKHETLQIKRYVIGLVRCQSGSTCQ